MQFNQDAFDFDKRNRFVKTKGGKIWKIKSAFQEDGIRYLVVVYNNEEAIIKVSEIIEIIDI